MYLNRNIYVLSERNYYLYRFKLKMNRTKAIISFFGGVTVIMGAMGSHALQKVLSQSDLKAYETAIYYQMFHLILLLWVNSQTTFSAKLIKRLNVLFGLGILFFSGSIFLFKLTSLSAKSLWFITPLGGILLIGGWFYLAYLYFKQTQ